MKMYQHEIHIIAAALLLCACGETEETVTFETVTAEKIAALSSDSIPPTCSVTIRLEQATAKSGRPGEIINSTVASRLFNRGDDGLKDAAQAFADEYTANYIKNLKLLYNQDKSDTTKLVWYYYHYIINSRTQTGSKGTLVYLTDINYREGGAHAVNQQIIMNFEEKTGRLLTLDDIFVDGYEPQLKNLLLNALKEKTGLSTNQALHSQGYLRSTDLYVPENFILSDNAITFVYNPDEIAPYSLGSIELTIGMPALETLLKSTFEH
jgi:hypothetical protein